MAINVLSYAFKGEDMDTSTESLLYLLPQMPETSGRRYNSQVMRGTATSKHGTKFEVTRILEHSLNCNFIVLMVFTRRTPLTLVESNERVLQHAIDLVGCTGDVELTFLPEGYLYRIHGDTREFEDRLTSSFRKAAFRVV